MATGATVLVLGPEDHGRAVSPGDFAGAAFREPWTYERVGGKLVVMAPPGQLHHDNSRPWRRALSDYWLRNPDRVEELIVEAWIRIGERTDRIGDIAVYLATEAPAPPIPDRVPDLVFEVVSPGKESRDRDYVEKRAEYHRIGVREYIIVDQFEGRATVLEWEEGAYRERVLTAADEYRSPLLPGLTLRLAEIF